MNYITRNLIEIYEERFKDDESYLAEKLEELEAHNKNKYDGLNFLCTSAESVTIKMYSKEHNLKKKISNFLKAYGTKCSEIVLCNLLMMNSSPLSHLENSKKT